ncbi:MAG: hypothetical protein VCD16_12440, partial [Planctomycetota bacterium]
MLLRGRPFALCLATTILASFCLLTLPAVHAWQDQNAEDALADKDRSFSAEAGHGSVTFGLNYY